MRLIVNGEEHDHAGEETLVALLKELSVSRAQVAVMINDDVISKEKYDQTDIREMDRIEILTFAPGG